MRGRPHLPSAGSCSSSQSASSQANLLPAQEDGSGSICCDIVIEDGPPELIGDPKRSLQITAVLARAQHHHHQGRSPSPDEPPHRHRRSCGYLKATIVVVAALVLGAIIVGSAVGVARQRRARQQQQQQQWQPGVPAKARPQGPPQPAAVTISVPFDATVHVPPPPGRAKWSCDLLFRDPKLRQEFVDRLVSAHQQQLAAAWQLDEVVGGHLQCNSKDYPLASGLSALRMSSGGVAPRSALPAPASSAADAGAQAAPKGRRLQRAQPAIAPPGVQQLSTPAAAPAEPKALRVYVQLAAKRYQQLPALPELATYVPWIQQVSAAAAAAARTLVPQVLQSMYDLQQCEATSVQQSLAEVVTSQAVAAAAAKQGSTAAAHGTTAGTVATHTTTATSHGVTTMVTKALLDPLSGAVVDSQTVSLPGALYADADEPQPGEQAGEKEGPSADGVDSSSSSSSGGGGAEGAEAEQPQVPAAAPAALKPQPAAPPKPARAPPAPAAACGACEPDNAVGVCAQGSCAVKQCMPGWHDCDGQPLNGCETEAARFFTDSSHCGGCNSVCLAPLSCRAGQCALTQQAPPGAVLPALPDTQPAAAAAGQDQGEGEEEVPQPEDQQQLPPPKGSDEELPSAGATGEWAQEEQQEQEREEQPGQQQPQQQQAPAARPAPATQPAPAAAAAAEAPVAQPAAQQHQQPVTPPPAAQPQPQPQHKPRPQAPQPAVGAPEAPVVDSAPAAQSVAPRPSTLPTKPQTPAVVPPRQPKPHTTPHQAPAGLVELRDDVARIAPGQNDVIIDVLSNDDLKGASPAAVHLSLVSQPATGTVTVLPADETSDAAAGRARPRLSYKQGPHQLGPGDEVEIYYTLSLPGQPTPAPATALVIGAAAPSDASLASTCPSGAAPASSRGVVAAGTPIAALTRADDAAAAVDLPFAVSMYGRRYTAVTVSSNGWVALGAEGSAAHEPCSAEGAWPNAPCLGSGPVLAPLWDDLVADQVLTHHDSRRGAFIIQWTNMMSPSSALPLGTFQALLFANGTAGFVYRDLYGTEQALGAGAVVGIRGPSQAGKPLTTKLASQALTEAGAGSDASSTWLFSAAMDGASDYTTMLGSHRRVLSPGLALIAHPDPVTGVPGSFKPWGTGAGARSAGAGAASNGPGALALPLLTSPDAPPAPVLAPVLKAAAAASSAGSGVATVAWSVPHAAAPHATPHATSFRLYLAADAAFDEVLRQPEAPAFKADVPGSARSAEVVLGSSSSRAAPEVWGLLLACNAKACSRSCATRISLPAVAAS